MKLVAAGGEVEWFHFPLSSKCSTKEPFGIWEDEEEKKRAIESERAECGGTSAESWEEQRSGRARFPVLLCLKYITSLDSDNKMGM